ncbi:MULTISPECIES: hypothetical protein [Levilactobacillus]|uniref:hypothetical protein n=1 Tax=Levilactobacillus TaxID=2767886 RepID=UPI001951F03D|nr:hypothetical protein [Levilactobacillus sp. 244-2]
MMLEFSVKDSDMELLDRLKAVSKKLKWMDWRVLSEIFGLFDGDETAIFTFDELSKKLDISLDEIDYTISHLEYYKIVTVIWDANLVFENDTQMFSDTISA